MRGMQARFAANHAGIILTMVASLVLGSCLSVEPRYEKPPPAKPAQRPTPPKTPQADFVAAFGGVYQSAAIERILNDITTRLTRHSDAPGTAFRVTVLNSPNVNAFALPSGELYITRGLLALASDTSEIAAVIAHEMAHVTARHAAEREALEKNADLISRVDAQILDNPARGQAKRDLSRITLASFSRQQEIEADKVGVRTLARAGFDPYGASRFLVSLGRNGALKAAGSSANSARDFMSTHPTTPERVSQALLAARQIASPGTGERDRLTWLKALDGLPYEDNPSDGFVRDQRYLNPILGIAFNVPEGFTLETGNQTVIGRSGGDLQALRFDRIEVAAGQSLEGLLKNLIDRASFDGIEAYEINGFKAVTGVATGREWSYRAALLQGQGGTFRLLYAARALTPDADRAFIASIRSFRLLQGDEIGLAKSGRIQLVQAQAGDTQESMTQRMRLVSRPLERFVLINGLERGAKLTPGETYKIIAD